MRGNAILFENRNITEQWAHYNNSIVPVDVPGKVPAGVTPGVPSEIYSGYRLGRDSACIDIVLCAKNPVGVPMVPLSLRAPNVCFGGTRWIYGGALGAYQPIEEFISGRAEKECGVPVAPEVFLGLYRTCAADHIGSTLQPCYAAEVSYQVLQAKMRTDEGHSSIELFALDDLDNIPVAEQHWYPMRVAKLALENIP